MAAADRRDRSDREVEVTVGSEVLLGALSAPSRASALVIFAHGSGSSRLSRRNRMVASTLQDVGLATLLFDLLTAQEERIDQVTAELRFDIGFLARRLLEVTSWVAEQEDLTALPLGYFGSSTGAAAALVAAAQRPESVSAIVSRGGRPDLAGDALPRVRAPTLLIVGGADVPVIRMNEDAMARMRCPVELEIVPGATHLFEEPGALEKVASLAARWFSAHLLELGSPRRSAKARR